MHFFIHCMYNIIKMPKVEKDSSKPSKEVVPYEANARRVRMGGEMKKNKTLEYYKFEKRNIERKLAFEVNIFKKLLATMAEMEKQLAAPPEICSETKRVSLKCKYEFIIKRCLPMHRSRIANVESQLKHANLRIREMEYWLAQKKEETEAITLELSAMLICSESESESDSDSDDDEYDSDDDPNEEENKNNEDKGKENSDDSSIDDASAADPKEGTAHSKTSPN